MSLNLVCSISLVILAVSILLLQYPLKPKRELAPVGRQSLLAFSLVLLLVSLVFTLMLLITKRPFFSTSISIILLVIIVAVSNAKYAALREPLVFSDFYLYFQAFKHPRLYLPFLGVWPIVLIVVVVIFVLVLGLTLESAYFDTLSIEFGILSLLIPIMFFLVFKLSEKLEISENVTDDVIKFGVFTTLILYFRYASIGHESLQMRIFEASPFNDYLEQSNKATGLADIVVVQSESFFDARLIDSNVRSDVLSEYDQLLKKAVSHGRLTVPAWGANTMRTEFSFLAGLNSSVLGLAQYYPYQQLLKYQVPSVLSHLKQLGYHCICIHPHAASFFMRDKFFGQLGFDEFIDEKSFEGASREGPYIADNAVTQKIKEMSNGSSKPLFIFAITMENHGPLHLESVSEGEWQRYFSQEPTEKSLDDLIVYLRHLSNADKMISELRAFFSSREKETLFGFYGDHVPAMSKVFEALDYEDSRSNFFIWSSRKEGLGGSNGGGQKKDLVVEDLACELIKNLHLK